VLPEALFSAYLSGFQGPQVLSDAHKKRSNGEPLGSLVQGGDMRPPGGATFWPLHGASGETQRLELGCGPADAERRMAEQQGLDREDRIS
jgi:hypothetical protein